MKYIDKYDLYIDDDLVVYRSYINSKVNGKHVPSCYLTQVQWQKLPNGYLYYRYYANGKNMSIYLHRLIAEVFVPNPENKPTVDHINHVRDDNRIENLQWATRKEQVAFRKLPEDEKKRRKREWFRNYYRTVLKKSHQ